MLSLAVEINIFLNEGECFEALPQILQSNRVGLKTTDELSLNILTSLAFGGLTYFLIFLPTPSTWSFIFSSFSTSI